MYFFTEIYTAPKPIITHATVTSNDGTYTDEPVIWNQPTIVDGKYAQNRNFTQNGGYFSLIVYHPTVIEFEINTGTTTYNNTGTGSTYWVMSQKFTCPPVVWISMKCFDAQNREVANISFRNGAAQATSTSLIAVQRNFNGTFNVQ